MEWFYVLIIIVGIILFIIFSLIILYFSYISPVSSGKLSENIVVIDGEIVNCFVYSKGSNRIMIDTGLSAKHLKKELLKLNINPETISHVFLTHIDIDHIGGISLFTNSKKYVGEESILKTPNDFLFLKDGDVIEVDSIKIQAISTPGHRLGHVSYLIDEEFLFTGDALRLKKGLIKPFFRILSSDYEKQIESIKKLSKLKNISILFTAHTGFTTNFDKAIEKWRKLE